MIATPGVELSAEQATVLAEHATEQQGLSENARVALLKAATQETNREMRSFQEQEKKTGRQLALIAQGHGGAVVVGGPTGPLDTLTGFATDTTQKQFGDKAEELAKSTADQFYSLGKIRAEIMLMSVAITEKGEAALHTCHQSHAQMDQSAALRWHVGAASGSLQRALACAPQEGL